jgi:hemolysin III
MLSADVLRGWLTFREPVSAWSHALGLILALPALWVLWRLTPRDPVKRFGLMVYGLTLAVCYLGSTLYHAVRLPPDEIAGFENFDHVGVILFIAGTVTPVALVVLSGRWKWGMLTLTWLFAATGIVLRLTGAIQAILPCTLYYLGMGWLVLFCSIELVRRLPGPAVAVLAAGGLLYTAGAVFHVMRGPVVYPGVFGGHEIFHLFVLAGSLVHFVFFVRVVVPFRRPPLSAQAPALVPAPTLAPALVRVSG